MQLCKESYIDEKLQLQITDVLFSVNYSEQPGYLYLLTEHQSRADFFMPLRLWKYILAIMEQHIAKSKEKILPIVYPMIYYNGHASYGYSTCFFDLFGEYKNDAKLILTREFSLIDLTKISDIKLREHIWSGIMGLSIRRNFIRDTAFLKTLISLLHDIEKNNAERYINMTLTYLAQTIDVSDREVFLDSIKESLTCNPGEKVMTIAESWVEEGKQQGMLEAKQSMASKLLKMGLSLQMVSQATGLTDEEITALEPA